jgi:hypothetical protein
MEMSSRERFEKWSLSSEFTSQRVCARISESASKTSALAGAVPQATKQSRSNISLFTVLRSKPKFRPRSKS